MARVEAVLYGNDPHAIFVEYAAPIGDRFAALAHLAANGDKNAQYYALQIARHCSDISKVADDQPSVGQTAATPEQIQLRAQLKASCLKVTSDAIFPEYEKLLQDAASARFDERMRQTMQLFFANKGPQEALHIAVSAIAQRPDDLTVGMVGEELANLDISSVYFRPEVMALAPADEAERNTLMHYALDLLSCHLGRPCGPNSFAVQSMCLEVGACVPGADLMGVFETQLLNARQMAYVRALLQYLQTIPTNATWQ
jgi:hypothetical protein